MMIDKIHTEHKHKRLVEQIFRLILLNLAIKKTIIGIFVAILTYFVLSLCLAILPGIINGGIAIQSLLAPIQIFLLLIFIVIILSITTAEKQVKYSSELTNVWLEKLFVNNWIVYFTDFDMFEKIRKEKPIAFNCFSLFNVNPGTVDSNSNKQFFSYFKSTRLYYDLTPRLYALHPSYKRKSIEYWISENKSVALIKILLIRIVFFGLFVFSISTFFSNLFFYLIFLVLVTYIALLPKSIARTCNAAVLRAILCALYLRDPEHEITDQRILGIPKYINYPDLCKRVDSYMIDS